MSKANCNGKGRRPACTTHPTASCGAGWSVKRTWRGRLTKDRRGAEGGRGRGGLAKAAPKRRRRGGGRRLHARASRPVRLALGWLLDCR